MDFFERQANARRQTRALLLLFVLAFAVVVVTLDVVLLGVLASMDREHATTISPLAYAAARPGAAVMLSLALIALLGLSSLYKSLQLRAGGGGVAARSLGGVRIARDTTDLKRKRLLNVVEEMAIASGVPVPEVYVLEQESAINAFAAGHTPANAAVTVTQGALDQLNREELQGVIAHEFSHVLNGDMRINVQLMGWLFGLFVIGLIGQTLLRVSPRGRRGNNALLAAALAFVVLGYIGMLVGRILQAAVSRQRERLADASAVQFTRNPPGLRGALLKIAGGAAGSRLTSANSDQVAHMLFAQGVQRAFATHPPLLERLQALDPSIKAADLPRLAAAEASLPDAFDDASLDGVAGLAAGAAAAGLAVGTATAAAGAATAAPAPASVSRSISARSLAAQIGNPQTEHIEEARAVRLALPTELAQYAESPAMARGLVLAMLLNDEPPIRAAQLEGLARTLNVYSIGDVQTAFAIAHGIAPGLRLPTALQVFPALRRLPEAEKRDLMRLTDDLIRADARVDVFEFCLARLLATLLEDDLDTRQLHGTLTLRDAKDSLAVLFAVIAQFGAANDADARMAYEAGMESLLPMERPAYARMEDWTQKLSEALSELERLQPFAKQALIEGLVLCVLRDQKLEASESDLLRVVCAVVHCPLPPIPDI